MPASPETIVGAEVRGLFAPPAGVRTAPTPVAYKLVRFVGAGKFAWVYEAQAIVPATDTPRRVAVKMLYREDTQGVRRFQREVKVMRQLPAHPNSVAYKGHGTWDKHAWVAMDFIDGFTLAAVLRSKKPLVERTACLLMTQLCDGFEGLHRLGLTHRDITPDNIMLTQADRQVKLMDFGLVQDSQGLLQLYEQVDILDGEDFKDDLDAGLIAGTPEFMAPEQILDPHEQDRARQKTDTTADVFALGTIFYQVLSGEQLFPYEVGARGATGKQGLINYLEYRVRLRDEDLVCPDTVDAELWSIVRKSLAHEPKLRQRDATELGADIRHYLETGQGVFEDDMSATIAAPFEPEQLKSLALQMSTGDFASIEEAAAAAGIALPGTSAPRRPSRLSTAPSSRTTARPATVPPLSARPSASLPNDGQPGFARPSASLPNDGQPGFARPSASLSNDGQPGFARPSASLPNEPLSPLAIVEPARPDAPLGPKKSAGERALYGGPASEKPTRIEGDAPTPGGYPTPMATRSRRTWLPWAIGAAIMALGALIVLLLKT